MTVPRQLAFSFGEDLVHRSVKDSPAKQAPKAVMEYEFTSNVHHGHSLADSHPLVGTHPLWEEGNLGEVGHMGVAHWRKDRAGEEGSRVGMDHRIDREEEGEDSLP